MAPSAAPLMFRLLSTLAMAMAWTACNGASAGAVAVAHEEVRSLHQSKQLAHAQPQEPHGSVCSAHCSCTWDTALPPMPNARVDLAAAAVGTVVYAVGGTRVGRDVFGPVAAFNASSQTWAAAVAHMPTPRSGLAAAAVGPVVYAIGGALSGAAIEAYNTSTGKWAQALPPMPTARGALAAGVVGTVIYALGGQGATGDVLATVEAFDTVALRWATLPPMPTARYNLAAAVVGSTVFALGGNSRPSTGVPTALHAVEAFDTAGLSTGSGSWVTLPPMPTARRGLAAGVVGSTIYAVGGVADTYPTHVVEAYDAVARAWSKALPPMPTARAGLAVGVVGATVYTFGGWSHGDVVAAVEALVVRAATLYVCDQGRCTATANMAGTSASSCAATCTPPPVPAKTANEMKKVPETNEQA